MRRGTRLEDCMKAFSLVELLTVIALISLLAGLAIPAISSLGKASSLGTAGNQLAALIDQGRQNSMSKNVMTALILMTDQGTESDYRAATLLEYDAEETAPQWKPVTKWANLPLGVVFDQSSTFFANSASPLPFVSPVVNYRGTSVNRYAARVFLPSGGLTTPANPAQIQLVEGVAQNGRVTLTRPDPSGKAANYYSISIVGATGRIKIDRP